MTAPSTDVPRPHHVTKDKTSVMYRAGDVRTLFAAIDRLTRELAEARAALAKAEAERDRAQEALRPFAALADEIERCAKENRTSVHAWSMSCAWEDLVAARAALAQAGERDA
jgi:multidrug resistance efflux pump